MGNKKIGMGKRWKSVRSKAIERDNRQCQKCGKFPKILSVHHVAPKSLYPELRFTLENLITLCEKCHRELHELISLARMQPRSDYLKRWLGKE